MNKYKLTQEWKNSSEVRRKILDKRLEIEYQIVELQEKLIKFDNYGFPGLGELVQEFGIPKEYSLPDDYFHVLNSDSSNPCS